VSPEARPSGCWILAWLWAAWLLLAGAGSAAATEPTRLVVWGLDTQSEWRRGAQMLVELFEARHDVEIVTFSPGTSSAQKALSAIAGGAAPDVMLLGTFTKDWVARGVVRPLDELIERDRDTEFGIHLDSYYSASLEHVRFQGQLYAIPDWAIGMALYYNRDILRQAGLVDSTGEPLPPATWAQWFEYNRVLSRRDENGNFTRIGCYPGPYVPSLYSLTRQLGGRFLSEDGRTFRVDGTLVRTAFERLLQFTDYFGGRKRLDAYRSSDRFSGIDPLFAGGEAMRIEGQWYITNFARFGPDVDYDVAPIPQFEGHPRVDFQITTAWGIPYGARHPELAWELIKWLVSDEAQHIKVRETIEFTKNRGRPFTPFTTANREINRRIEAAFVRDNPVFPHKTRRAYAKFVEILETATWLRPVNTPVGQLMDDELRRAYEAASLHSLTAKEGLARARVTVQNALDMFWEEESLPVLRWRWLLAVLAAILAAIGLWIFGWALRQARVMGRHSRREALAGLLFISPWIVGFVGLLAGPMALSIALSFTRYSVLRAPRWVGLDNYLELVTEDPLFWKSLGNTMFMMIGVPLGLVVGLAIALLLNRAVRGVAVYRTIYFLPSIVPAVASSILWMWIFHPTSGLMNTVLDWVGIDGPLWLQSEAWAKPAILLNGLWAAGGGMIIWLAGLRAIPAHLYEAAEIDGATAWTKFRYVTLPMLTPYVFFNLVMGTIGTLQVFTQAVVMTKGGPLDATLFYAYHLFNNAFEYFRMGYASAMAWILFVVILAITIAQLKLAPRWVYYEGGRS
jgi:multiple sugar transport system permease protein